MKNENGNASPYHVSRDDGRAIHRWANEPNPSLEMTHEVVLQDAYLPERGRIIVARPPVAAIRYQGWDMNSDAP
jgi:hypothetical protein